MRHYVERHNIPCNFSNGNSWVIISDYVLKLKTKIESVGKPLNKWDLSINYGIKTGYDKAFWINRDKRDELLSWCISQKERTETEEIIKPLLRGKDINKYGYNWADLWLICTFPSRKLDIEKYPAIKKHLLSFTKERLEQTGKKYIVNGEEIKSRKKTNGNWFELQDSISYWQDFKKTKIIYPETTKFLPFVLDENGFYANKTCFIMTGRHLAYLTAFFNSSLFKFCFRDNFGTLFGGARSMSKIFFDKIPVLDVTDKENETYHRLVLDIQKNYSDEKAKAIDQLIFDHYGLTQPEKDTIGYIDFHTYNDTEKEE